MRGANQSGVTRRLHSGRREGSGPPHQYFGHCLHLSHPNKPPGGLQGAARISPDANTLLPGYAAAPKTPTERSRVPVADEAMPRTLLPNRDFLLIYSITLKQTFGLVTH